MSLDLSTLKTRVRRFVGDVSSDTTKQRYSDTIIQDAINDAISEFAADSLLKKDTSEFTSVAGDNEYSFPSDAFKVYRMDLDGKLLYATSMQELDNFKRDWKNDDSAEPILWYPTTARLFKLYPSPSATFASLTGNIYYFDIPASITSSTESPDFAAEYHIAAAHGAAATVLTMDREFDLATAHQAKFEVFKQKAATRLRRMEDRAKEYRMGLDRGYPTDGNWSYKDYLTGIFWRNS